MTRLGYQVPNFTCPGVGPDQLLDRVAAQAKEADGSGFDTALVMNHFCQLPRLGDPDRYVLECSPLLSALARETSTVRLSALITRTLAPSSAECYAGGLTPGVTLRRGAGVPR